MGERFIIGVTGHRYLPQSLVPYLSREILACYESEKARRGRENITVLSSLALGADTIFARLALEAGFRLEVPLPMPAPLYREDFQGLGAEFDSLMSLADKSFVVPPAEPVPPSVGRGFKFRQAGIYVARECDVLIAIWNGLEIDSPDGAGTWETVKLARAFGKPVTVLPVPSDATLKGGA